MPHPGAYLETRLLPRGDPFAAPVVKIAIRSVAKVISAGN